MDDRRAHFLTMLGDTCASAGLASLPIGLVLIDGRRVSGTPSPQPTVDEAADALEQTGYANRLLIDDESVAIDEVIEFAVRSPDLPYEG